MGKSYFCCSYFFISMNNMLHPFSWPIQMMAKPVGARCNLACDYCYYLGKTNLSRETKPPQMSEETLEIFIREYLSLPLQQHVVFNWHGGEALLLPVEFYQKALDLQKKYGQGRQVENCIQTNGTLLTDEWCAFFRKNNFLVGISVDGPPEFHDRYRKAKNGNPSFQKVIRGLQLLKKHRVDFNIMAVVNHHNADFPLEFYRFFKQLGCMYIQFTPIVERLAENGTQLPPESLGEAMAPYSVSPQQWGNFLCSLFDEWVKEDVGKVFIQLFDSTLANWAGEQPGVCTLAKTCGHAGVVESNGDVYGCDHFVFPEYKLGNIHNESLLSMMYSERQIKFGLNKQALLPKECKRCDYLFACQGECPKNRFAKTETGDIGLNYLCQGYQHFFKHISPYMDFMKTELENGRPPANIMWLFRK